jgi:predicted Zn-dependent protease with MMP-like domain
MARKSDEDRLLDALDGALDAVDVALDDGDFAAARRALARAVDIAGPRDAEVLYAGACIALEADGPGAAEPLFAQVIAADASHADAHYALAQLAGEREDHAKLVEHFLRVHALDARGDREARIGTRKELDHIEQVARELLAALPSPFAEKLEPVPVVLERRPSRDLVREGFDPRALGLFEGPTYGEQGAPAPTRIVLFVNNLLADFPEDPELSEQVEITLLHEIGHYFGLDEDDMVRLGLD